MIPLYTAAQTRDIDREACAGADLSGFDLMGRAAEALWEVVRSDFARATDTCVYAGSGNNAGDGYLLAVLMHRAGRAVRVAQVGDPGRLDGDARRTFEQARDAGVAMGPWAQDADDIPDLAVDALLGTGLARAPQGDFAMAIEQINRADLVLAVDIPSGLCADTGVAHTPCVAASVTVTFIARKQGLYTADGPDHTGRIRFAGLAVEAEQILEADAELLSWEHCRTGLARRLHNTHKGSYGHVLVVGGSAGYEGAAVLCAMAALRAGCGTASIVRPVGAAPVAAPPELMCHVAGDRRTLTALVDRADVLVVGPGLGRDETARDILATVLELNRPLVLDADALRLVATDPCSREDWILTPHPGEAAALLGIDSARVQGDRIGAARALAERYGGVAVLKGCGTIIADAGGVAVCEGGNPGMATAGTGDVLGGIIASLLAQGQTPAQASRTGVCLHAAAGDHAARRGEAGLVAGDLLASVQRVLGGET